MPEKAGFDDLVELMTTLRSPEGCPWDREQTHDSIKSHLVEEAFEVIESIERRNFTDLQEELGDLLLQVVFHAQLAAEADRFDINDVLRGIIEKLKRRHPHIYGRAKLDTSEEVLVRWEHIKAGEKERDSYLAGVPSILPALAYAQKLQEKAARVGFDWGRSEDILDKLSEEISEFLACEKRTREIEDEFGDILFTLVNFARHLDIDCELALRRVCKKFQERFAGMEERARAEKIDFAGADLAEKDRLWNLVKEKEKLDDDN